MSPIPIIDLFAGPGGLGEGFSSASGANDRSDFKIALSIEKDDCAHKTLELRAFFRQFSRHKIPGEYYDYLDGKISRANLVARYPRESMLAQHEAWHAELGVTPERVIDARIAGALKGASEWLLIGGPPCQAYSLVGRSKMIGEKGVKAYEADHRHFLYREYLRIIAVHRPRVFVMENVKGLLSAKVDGKSTLSRILDDLRQPVAAIFGGDHRDASTAYRLVSVIVPNSDLVKEHDPIDFLVRAEEYGVPQARHRLIIVGLAERVQGKPKLLARQNKVTVDQAIGDLPPLRSGLSKEPDSGPAWHDAVKSIQASAWLKSPQVDQILRREILASLKSVSADLDRGFDSARQSCKSLKSNVKWFRPDGFNCVCNHATRGHIRADLHRYFFLAAFARVHDCSPLLEDFPRELLPKHNNVAEALLASKFNDRFRVQVANRPATTVVSHIAKDGHYFIHPDPAQCRSLTVREAARLQTFPDNYFFEGPRTKQYHQVGNAVPPFLSYQIANVIGDLFD